ncbi:hypothetical protein DQ400_05265 [Vreelandella sulfidaeris]|uniref:Uncharacterized protein n=1 Tax=Vreelandella sulfidaeris TaxID=115553 RepID=A0A365TRZ9_9GAMM|nr:hypothetical protein [Halomonas sulfidaeris]RBI68777.1 hypothetical protein DQ400_05265 [Halomonas sulfidaeris]
MLVTKPSRPKCFLLTFCVEGKTLLPDIWLPEASGNLSYLQYLALRITVSLIAFQALHLILINHESIETMIAIFSVGASTTALFLSKIKTKGTTAWLLSYIEDEIIETTNTIGSAGVGTLVVIYLLA